MNRWNKSRIRNHIPYILYFWFLPFSRFGPTKNRHKSIECCVICAAYLAHIVHKIKMLQSSEHNLNTKKRHKCDTYRRPKTNKEKRMEPKRGRKVKKCKKRKEKLIQRHQNSIAHNLKSHDQWTMHAHQQTHTKRGKKRSIIQLSSVWTTKACSLCNPFTAASLLFCVHFSFFYCLVALFDSLPLCLL